MRLIRVLPIALGAALLAGAAQATPIVGSGTFSDLGLGGGDFMEFSAIAGAGANQQINLNLAPGQSATINDFMEIEANDTNFTFVGIINVTHTLREAFSITAPGSGSSTLSGSGNESQQFFFGAISGGTGQLTWGNPLTLALDDGAALQISLQNVSFKSTYGAQDVWVGATVKLVSDPTPVPEPAGLAVLASGLLGLGVIRRRLLLF